jgi:predicted nucleic acid-binding protein
MLEEALASGIVVLPPLVVAELVSGAERPADREAIGDLLQDLPVHHTPLEHWIRVGDLRLLLRNKGVEISTPDAHVAQCALDLNALLLSRDKVFREVSRYTSLRLEG